jgi:hypothetical protein
MAWWTVGIHDDEIGDQPANLVEIALDEFASARRADGAPLPTPAAFLDALAHAMIRCGSPSAAQGIEERAAGKVPVIHPGRDDDVDPQLVALTDALVAKLTGCYRQYLDRDARPAELCAVIAFVLRHEPQRFLAHAENWNLQVLRPTCSPKVPDHQG